jgi:hypothetical protein
MKPRFLLVTFSRLFFIWLLAFGLSGCSKNSALVGKWQGSDPKDVMEFDSDGKFSQVGDKDMKGTFSYNGDTLTLKLDGAMGSALGEISAPAKVDGDTLTITDQDKTVETYKKVK